VTQWLTPDSSKALLPTEFGGTALSIVDFAVAAEELAAADITCRPRYWARDWACNRCCAMARRSQKQKFLPDFIENGSRLAAFAFTEVTVAQYTIARIQRSRRADLCGAGRGMRW